MTWDELPQGLQAAVVATLQKDTDNIHHRVGQHLAKIRRDDPLLAYNVAMAYTMHFATMIASFCNSQEMLQDRMNELHLMMLGQAQRAFKLRK